MTTIDCCYGNCSFVTEFIAVELARNDEPAQKYIEEVSELFTEAGFYARQVNPRNLNPHANLIRNVDGDYITIDLES